jgi:hypothetical protein
MTLDTADFSLTWDLSLETIGGAGISPRFYTASNADNGIRYRLRASDGTILATTVTLTVHAVSINCPMRISATADSGKCTASGINPSAPTATSDCGTATVTGSRSDGKPLADPYPVGNTSITWTAGTTGGGSASCNQTVTVVDQEKPAFTNCPPTGTTAIATYTTEGIGALVSFTPLSATDNCGTPTVTCDHQPGSFFAPGHTTVTATATDAAGNATTCPFTVSVAYAWSGVLQPINADGSSVFKLGNTVPVIFQLTGPSACISTLAATLAYTKVSSSVSSPVNKAGSTSAATSGSLFRYSNGQYVFNWGTKGLASGTYQLQIDLGDGASRTINLGLK